MGRRGVRTPLCGHGQLLGARLLAADQELSPSCCVSQRRHRHAGGLCSGLTAKPGFASIRLSPPSTIAHLAEPFDVQLEVFAGHQVVDRVHAFVDFDPAVLQVVDAQGNPASEVEAGGPMTNVILNAVDNASGRIGLVSEGRPPRWSLPVANVHFKPVAVSAGTAIGFSLTAPGISDLLLDSQTVLQRTRDASVAVLPSVFLAGQAEMQRQAAAPDPTWSVPLQLQLARSGSTGPAYVYGTRSNKSGAFVLPGVVDPGVLPGSAQGVALSGRPAACRRSRRGSERTGYREPTGGRCQQRRPRRYRRYLSVGRCLMGLSRVSRASTLARR